MSALTLFLDQLKPLATTSVQIRPKASYNNYGEPQYAGSATTYSAYIQYLSVGRRNLEQTEVVAEYQAYIPSSSLSVSLADEVTFPDSTIRPIVAVDVRRDEMGQQFVVLSLGKPM